MNKIIYQIKALKQLRQIQSNALIRNKINELAYMPNCINVKTLTNHKYQYRLRMVNYRVFF
nr:hypothetical protein [Gilliamella sp. Lep-s35]